MSTAVDLTRRLVNHKPWHRRMRVVCGVAVAAVLLNACGGGDQVKTFAPSNIVSFGDENSALASEAVGAGQLKGLKYTINNMFAIVGTSYASPSWPTGFPTGATSISVSPTGAYPSVVAVSPFAEVLPSTGDSVVRRYLTLDVTYTPTGGSATTVTGATVGVDYYYSCTENRLWIQLLANAYGFGYQTQCPLEGASGAVTHATAGAKVADIAAQVAANRGSIGTNTLVTMFAGQNDVVEQFNLVMGSGTSQDAAKATLKVRGQQLGQVVNGIITTGARVVVMTLPDLGYSPKASANRDLMRALVTSFNDGLLSSNGLKSDGRRIGRVKGFEQIRDMARDPAAFALVNATDAACDTARKPADGSLVASTDADFAKYCNELTLRSGATAFNYLWADDTHISPAAHASLGNLAFVRARDNPF